MSVTAARRSYLKKPTRRDRAPRRDPWHLTGAAFLAVLVYSGQMKTLPGLSWLPVDLTVIAGVLVALSIVGAVYHQQWIDKRIFWMLGLWVLFLIPVASFASNGYGFQKIATLVTFTLFCAVGPFFLLRTDAQRRAFLMGLIVIGGILSLASFAGGLLTSETGTAIEGLNPIGASRAMATGAVIMLFYGLSRGRPAASRWFWILAAAAVTLLLFASGRRGPVLALAVAVVITVALAPAFRAHRGRSILLALLAGAGALWAVIRSDSMGADRIFDSLGGAGDASTSARTYIWGEALEIMSSTPFGIGWGQFPLHAMVPTMTTMEGRMYPHNLVLEVFTEAGWVVGLALLVVLVVACFRAVRGATDSTMTVFLALTVYSGVNAMVSGDVNDQKLLWVALAVAMMTKAGATHEKAAALSGVR